MYNADQKEQFLKESCSTPRAYQTCRAVLQAVEQAELQVEKDIAEFSAEQLKETLRKFRLTKVSSAAKRLQIFRRYQAWCRAHSVHTSLSAKQLAPEDICRTESFMAGSPGELQRILDEALSDESVMSTDSVLRLYYWCAFAGLPEENIEKILISDVNIDAATIRCGETYYRLEWLGQNSLRQCVFETKMYATIYVPEEKIRLRKRSESNFLFRSVRSRVLTYDDLRKFAMGRAASLPTYRDIQSSGIFYRVFSESTDPEKKEIDFDCRGYQLYLRLSGAAPQDAAGERTRQLIFKREYLQWLQTFYGR